VPRAKRRTKVNYNINVFVNCPFDAAYTRLFRSIVFTVIHCGFRARCALEIDDASEVRIDKIMSIVEQCRFGIHDISRTELDRKNRLPRFNMPLELGIFLAAKRFGAPPQTAKMCLIFDRHPFRYQKFISDIAGQDIQPHARKDARAIALTRDWLSSCTGRTIPGGAHIERQYGRFKRALPKLCRELHLKQREMTFNDFTNIATKWLTVR
jgi:hypothetical protein